jgi:hypothetical protein
MMQALAQNPAQALAHESATCSRLTSTFKFKNSRNCIIFGGFYTRLPNNFFMEANPKTPSLLQI